LFITPGFAHELSSAAKTTKTCVGNVSKQPHKSAYISLFLLSEEKWGDCIRPPKLLVPNIYNLDAFGDTALGISRVHSVVVRGLEMLETRPQHGASFSTFEIKDSEPRKLSRVVLEV
jgi:hypothetical protein